MPHEQCHKSFKPAHMPPKASAAGCPSSCFAALVVVVGVVADAATATMFPTLSPIVSCSSTDSMLQKCRKLNACRHRPIPVHPTIPTSNASHTIPYHAMPISFLQLYTTHIIHSYHQCSRNGGDIVRWVMAPTYRAYRQHNHCVNVTSSHPIASPSGSWGVSKRDCVLPSFIYWEYCTLVGYSSSKEVTTEAWSDSLLMHLKKFRYLLSY